MPDKLAGNVTLCSNTAMDGQLRGTESARRKHSCGGRSAWPCGALTGSVGHWLRETGGDLHLDFVWNLHRASADRLCGIFRKNPALEETWPLLGSGRTCAFDMRSNHGS